jgi:FdhD protein
LTDVPTADSRSSVARRPTARRSVVVTGFAGREHVESWGIAVEAPIEIALNGTPWTVMLATPADVEDLAIGLATTERVLRDAQAVRQVVVSEYLHDIAVNIVAPDDQIDTRVVRSRSLLSSTACGLCGLESLAELHGRAGRHEFAAVEPVDDAAVLRAFAALPAQQPINRATRSVHAAAWCTTDGDIALVREDVGRHNALDKLIGALARAGQLSTPGFVLMSSRCSYELVYKAAAANTHLLATISAPTTMALEWSAALSLPLACCWRGEDGDRVVRFPVHDSEASDAR